MNKDCINKNKLAGKTEADKIKGFDLKIDSKIQEICGVYNKTSGSTRTVIYVLLLINIIALVGVLNTTPWNWMGSRVANINDTVRYDERHRSNLFFEYNQKQSELKQRFTSQTKIPRPNKNNFVKQYSLYRLDSLKNARNYQFERMRDSDKVDGDMEEMKSLIRNKIDNTQHISIPLMGNSFDVNDLAQIAGLSFIVLLIMLRFTLAREKDNLKIAFNAISERYVDDLIEEEYLNEFLKYLPLGMDPTLYRRLVNFKRRRYHYNSLSMNEIFNLPKLDISKDLLQKTPIGQLVKEHIFFFPYIIYTIIFLNDILTGKNGFRVSFAHTLTSYILSICWLSVVAYLCHSCNYQKKAVNKWFDVFYENDYQGDRTDYVKSRGKQWSNFENGFYFPSFILRGSYCLYLWLKRRIVVMARKCKSR